MRRRLILRALTTGAAGLLLCVATARAADGTTLHLPNAERVSVLPATAADPATRHGDPAIAAQAQASAPPDDSPTRPEAPVPFDPSPLLGDGRRQAKSPTLLRGEPDSNVLPDLSGEKWALAPIRWSGNTTSSRNSFNADDGSKSKSVNNTLNVQANSFVIAPYIAQWSGLLGVSASDSQFTPPVGPQTKSDGTALNAGGGVNIFPLSRFPFSGNFSRAVSEANTNQGSGLSTTQSTLNLRQMYRTEDGKDNFTGALNRNSLVSDNAESRVTSLQGGYSANREYDYGSALEGVHALNANVGYSSVTGDASGQRSQLLNASVAHDWTVHEDLRLNNVFAFADNSVELVQGNSLLNSKSQVLTAGSAFNWRPFETSPLMLNGGGNFVQTATQTNGVKSDLQALAGYVSSNYRFDNNLSASGSVSLVTTSARGGRTTSSQQSVALSYTGDSLPLGSFIYGWGVGTGLSNTTSSAGGGSAGGNVSASHNLVKTITVDEANVVNLSASQSVFLTQQNTGSTSGFSQLVGASWRAVYGDRLSANWNATVSDTVSQGETGDSRFRSMNFSGSGFYQISSRASVSANANVVKSQSVVNNDSVQQFNGILIDNSAPQLTGSYSLGYAHRSPFSVARLNYNASVVWVSSQSNQRIVGPVTGAFPEQNQNSKSFQQMLDYRVGRLIFRLNYAVIEQGGKKSASVFATVSRDFDGFF